MVVGGRELIDTLWNVNSNGDMFGHDNNSELIDTLWNVNQKILAKDLKENWELIDTLWNVNVKKVSDSDDLNWGINRYIMECKFIFAPFALLTIRN